MLVGGGIGVFTDIETRAGFDYPTKITFIVKSCSAPQSLKSEEVKNKSPYKERESESAKSYPVKTGLSSESQTKPSQTRGSNLNTQETDKSESSKTDDKQEVNSVKRESGKPKPVPYCKQLDMAIPGCSFQWNIYTDYFVLL